MGIQDRDYYWEKHQKAEKANVVDFDNLLHRKTRTYRKMPKKSNGNLRFLLLPTLMLFVLWYGANKFMAKFETGLTPGGIVIQADHSGHFRGKVLINGVSMPFMIDTGATKTTVPVAMAKEAGLPFGMLIQSKTAGGIVEDHATRIESLKIGNAEIRNLSASINQHIDHVLIGMNTLKHFHMTQSENKLTLVTDNQTVPQQAQIVTTMPLQDEDIAASTQFNNQRVIRSTQAPAITTPNLVPNHDAAESNAPIKKMVRIKKTVTCDARNICTTKYSDH